jgi:hypothetical protein
MLSYHNTATFPNGRMHSKIDHILLGKRWYSSVVDVQSFRGIDCNTKHSVVAKVGRRPSISKQAAQKFETDLISES